MSFPNKYVCRWLNKQSNHFGCNFPLIKHINLICQLTNCSLIGGTGCVRTRSSRPFIDHVYGQYMKEIQINYGYTT